MDPPEFEFERRLRNAIRESIALAYNPTRIAEMTNTHGGKETAKLLVKSGEIQDGLQRIVEMGYPKLSVESIMLEAQFTPPFTPAELEAARWRLQRAGAAEE